MLQAGWGLGTRLILTLVWVLFGVAIPTFACNFCFILVYLRPWLFVQLQWYGDTGTCILSQGLLSQFGTAQWSIPVSTWHCILTQQKVLFGAGAWHIHCSYPISACWVHPHKLRFPCSQIKLLMPRLYQWRGRDAGTDYSLIHTSFMYWERRVDVYTEESCVVIHHHHNSMYECAQIFTQSTERWLGMYRILCKHKIAGYKMGSVQPN